MIFVQLECGLRSNFSPKSTPSWDRGGHTNTQVPLRQVFIDLPIAAEPSASFLHEDRALFLKCLLSAEPLNLQTVFRSGADIGSPLHANKEECDEDIELYGAALDDIHLKTQWGATLLIGGPGQGKSTLGQLACQLNRAALIRPAIADLTSAQRDIVHSFIPASEQQEDSFEANSIELLNNPLQPLYITLPEFAEWAAKWNSVNSKENIPSFLLFLADLPSAKAVGW